MNKSLTIIAAVAFAIPVLAPRAEAQFTFIPYLGYDLDFEALFIGAGAEFTLLPANGLPVDVAIRPSAEFYFLETAPGVSQSLFQINADAVANLLPGPVGVFAGAGLGISFYSVDFDNGGFGFGGSSTDVGLNLLGGVEFGTGFAVPFAQLRLSTMPGSRIGLMGGVKLGL